MRSANSIVNYLENYHPEVLKEVEERLKALPCNDGVVELVHSLSHSFASERWQIHLITIAATLALCSPETIYVGCRLRLGVGTSLASILGISRQRIGQKLEASSHYFKNISWCREAVDSIVKEVRANKEVNSTMEVKI